MTIDVRPQGNGTASARTPSGSAQGSSQRKMILVGIGAGAVYRLLRSHRFHVSAVTIAIGAAAIGHIAKENNTKSMERLVAWAKKQDERLEHKVKQVGSDAKKALPG
jgi:queuine/archaeosine tRNA-ribosyltransferase